MAKPLTVVLVDADVAVKPTSHRVFVVHDPAAIKRVEDAGIIQDGDKHYRYSPIKGRDGIPEGATFYLTPVVNLTEIRPVEPGDWRMRRVESKNVYSVGYFQTAPGVCRVRVQFKDDKDQGPGALYEYQGVPFTVWDALWSTVQGKGSVGSFVQKFLVKKFPTTKVTDYPEGKPFGLEGVQAATFGVSPAGLARMGWVSK